MYFTYPQILTLASDIFVFFCSTVDFCSSRALWNISTFGSAMGAKCSLIATKDTER